MKIHSLFLAAFILLSSCGKESAPNPVVVPQPQNIAIATVELNGSSIPSQAYGQSVQPVFRVRFTGPVLRTTADAATSIVNSTGALMPVIITYPFDSVMQVQMASNLAYLSKFTFKITTTLKSKTGGALNAGYSKEFSTVIDSTDKFPIITDDELLTKIQQQTFKYFWDFGHPTSGLARERNTSGDLVTSGGSGFGIMSIPVGISRNFITRADGFARVQKIVAFLKNNAVTVKGAFPHWLNGVTGAIIPFSANDNGADLVETSYLMMGLLTARQYFNGAAPAEVALRADINSLYNAVEWDWFRQGGQDVLTWHYSNDRQWAINLKIRGWNECLITYVLAAASPTHPIPTSVYTNGWKGNANFINGNTYFGVQLPLGPSNGGPLFFEHYSFMGINPTGLQEAGINYFTQAKNHTLINRNYCIANPKNWYGYSTASWGLTASDIENGYTASDPNNDQGFIAPTAALSSFPYTPTESMAALKFFYYKLGDKLFKEYGFVDAFSLSSTWVATSTLAIDQGPIINMIENQRTGLLWNLFTSAPEVKASLLQLGFTAPYL